jgi:hypothetical protein
MKTSFFSKIRRYFIGHPKKTPSEIAVETAHRCLEKVVNRMDRDCEFWSEAKLHGYLRAVAIPCIDSALTEISADYPLIEKSQTKIEVLAFDTLEDLVLEKIRNRRFAHSPSIAAA